MNSRGHKFDILAVLLILCVFSAAILSLLLSGAGTYKNITEKDRASQQEQILELFISNKVFQAENRDSVRLTEEGGVSILAVDSIENGEPHVTRVWCYGGWIRELYSDAGYNFTPDDGEKIAKAEELSFTEDGGLLKVRIVSSGKEDIRYFDMKGGKR
ncbi:MAG: DUF4860 domain-containing protein [Firmicutes bacterium]|nr:DUF4860 domain-containing protein [Bacillota bacterium]